MTYAEINKDKVIDTVGSGVKVVICDFDTLRMMDCNSMSIAAINSFIAKDNTKFFKGVANE